MGANLFRIAKRAALLCASLVAATPQISAANAVQTRFIVGVTVVAPCRVGTRIESPVSCPTREAHVATLATRIEATAATEIGNRRVSQNDASYANFVEIAF